MALGSLAACVVINTLDLCRASAEAVLIRQAARFMMPMAAMPLLALWYFVVLPADSRSWLLGGSAAMSMFVVIAAGATSLLIGAYAIVGLVVKRLYISGATRDVARRARVRRDRCRRVRARGRAQSHTPCAARCTLRFDPAVRGRWTTAERCGRGRSLSASRCRALPERRAVHGAKGRGARQCDACHTLNGANASRRADPVLDG